MSAPDYRPRQTKHTPVITFPRDRPAMLMAGEPRCGAPNGPGTTTTIDAGVTCEKCLAILRTVH